MTHHLERTAAALLAHGRGILAADETVPTLTKRFNQLGIQSTEHSRRTYREMLFTTVGAGGRCQAPSPQMARRLMLTT